MDAKTEAIIRKSVEKAMGATNAALLGKVAARDVTGSWHLKDDPPILTPVDKETRDAVIERFKAYAQTLSPERPLPAGPLSRRRCRTPCCRSRQRWHAGLSGPSDGQ
jgi:hypothetical protein